jgi:hypothetical protein
MQIARALHTLPDTPSNLLVTSSKFNNLIFPQQQIVLPVPDRGEECLENHLFTVMDGLNDFSRWTHSWPGSHAWPGSERREKERMTWGECYKHIIDKCMKIEK